MKKNTGFPKLKLYIKAEKKMTQGELADAIGMDRAALNSRLNGRVEFSLSEVRDICLYLKVSSDTFFLNPEVSYSITKQSA
ncbi:helix-turn-helix transcriptional regulator [Enterococcus wangshanyuanii]|uniref:HTH cro/C1-type domain-containing protein n=1 Tax=Enterococcus wangshanyuanii TaxID=2005703 RepID=A0ABQ1P088_9ENTE|nr:helix-turn-helix transcriptional regulator [Enterococcus wangshanyuanii]GGC88330.1 hypothetical protein GCM10011573_17430 [Enterococcus wangshanyuanii]